MTDYGPRPDDPRVVGLVEPPNSEGGANGSDIWRVVRPFYELAKRGYNVEVHAADRGGALPELHADIAVITRQLAPDRAKAQAFVRGCHELSKTAVVIDWDDLPGGHRDMLLLPGVARFDDPIAHVAAAWDWCETADAVTSTTPYLAGEIRGRNKRSYWLPNLAERHEWFAPYPVGRPATLTIGVMGGHTHGKDWSILTWLWSQLARKYPRLHFVVVAWEPEYLTDLLPPDRYTHLAPSSGPTYASNMRWIDIGLAPLVDDRFNRAKSAIKWVEYTLSGACSVVSDVMYSEWVSNTAMIARTSEDWLTACSALIEHKWMRQELHRRALKEVESNHVWTDEKCRAWMDVYRQIYAEVFHGDSPSHANVRSGQRAAGLLAGRRGHGLPENVHAVLRAPRPRVARLGHTRLASADRRGNQPDWLRRLDVGAPEPVAHVLSDCEPRYGRAERRADGAGVQRGGRDHREDRTARSLLASAHEPA